MAHVLPRFLTSVPDDVERLSAQGMTLFFVLSGFVIHYNYSSPIMKNKSIGLYNFFVARFARLYPLFIIGLLLEYYKMHGMHFNSEFWRAIPYYLTLTQSWVYFIIKDNALIYQFHFIGAVGWSVSTEWFFYVAYPLVCLTLFGVTSLSTRLLMMFAVSAIMITAVWFTVMHSSEISQYGLAHFGPIADMANGSQDSLFRWIVYFSPYARVAEFVMGCIVAAIYMDYSHKTPSHTENRLGFYALVGFIIMAAVAQYVIFHASGSYGWMATLVCRRHTNHLERNRAGVVKL
jgi:peptidoglycan/LPS O-acetylase OafA/YrhL